MWWLWVVGGLVVWLLVAVLLSLVIGRGIRMADRRSPGTGHTLTTADLPGTFVAEAPVAAPRRRAVPLPPVGIALAATAVALETVGFLLRLNGATGRTAQVLSMDAPFALPRLFIAMLFAVASIAAVVAAAQAESRRTWWLAVAVVAAGIASVKAGGTVHADAIGALEGALGAGAAVVLSAVAAAVVVAGLWSFTRTERRDRRRILGTLGCYAVASVGLSAVSAYAPAGWATATTYLEESGEALAGVAFLIAVLVGVAPRLVLPASWVLRRATDAQPVDAPAAAPLAERS